MWFECGKMNSVYKSVGIYHVGNDHTGDIDVDGRILK
jgi:hypothetical protein